MTEFRKTLQDGTPGTAEDAAAPRGVPSSAGAPGIASPHRVVSVQPAAPALPSEPGPPSSNAYNPPPAGSDELRRTRPPPGNRTPSATHQAPDFGPPLPDNAAGWMLRARRMSLALEEAIRSGQAGPSLEASIERAWAAWELDGSTDKQIARVARLVDKAHTAIRETPVQKLETAYNECAQVLWAGLPRQVKSKQEFAQVLLILRDLRSEADSWAAVVDATSKLLGWSQAARAHAAQSVRVAILSERTVS